MPRRHPLGNAHARDRRSQAGSGLRHNARQLHEASEMRDSRLSRDVVSSSPALSATQRMKTGSLLLRTGMRYRDYFPVRACCVMVEIVLVCAGWQLPKKKRTE